MGLEFDHFTFLTLKFLQYPFTSTKKYAESSAFESKYIETQLCENCFKTFYFTSHRLQHESKTEKDKLIEPDKSRKKK